MAGIDNTEIHSERKGLNLLTLSKLADPRQNFSKQWCQYELQHRWLSQTGGVLGSEITLYPAIEMKDVLIGLDQGQSIFDFFNLF